MCNHKIRLGLPYFKDQLEIIFLRNVHDNLENIFHIELGESRHKLFRIKGKNNSCNNQIVVKEFTMLTTNTSLKHFRTE